jgi:hypothetical protein
MHAAFVQELSGSNRADRLARLQVLMSNNPVFSLDSCEGALLKLAVGPHCRLCVFEPGGFGFQLMAEYPPSASVPSAQHNNATSREICSVMRHSRYDWNDLYALAPTANSDVDPSALLELVSERKIPSLTSAWHGRMERSRLCDTRCVLACSVAARYHRAAHIQRCAVARSACVLHANFKGMPDTNLVAVDMGARLAHGTDILLSPWATESCHC